MNARCYQLLGNLVCHGADERKRIALTFDDAPSERTSDAVLAVLAEKNVKATFFMIGENIERYPQAAQRIAAAGHEMGNHSYSAVPHHNEQAKALLDKGITLYQKQDYQHAMPYFEQAQQAGHMKAPRYLGLMYLNGAGAGDITG